MAIKLSAELTARFATLWPAILDQVAAGETLRSISDEHGVSVVSLLRYARSTPALRAELDDAMEISADVLVDGFDAIITAASDHRRARVLAEYRWKVAVSRNPGRYSERRQVDMRVQALDMSAVLAEAQRRLEAREQARIEYDVTPARPALVMTAIVADLL